MRNEELHNSHSSPNIIRIIESRVASEPGSSACKVLVENPEAKRAVGLPKRR
jgi:hypothetical protein